MDLVPSTSLRPPSPPHEDAHEHRQQARPWHSRATIDVVVLVFIAGFVLSAGTPLRSVFRTRSPVIFTVNDDALRRLSVKAQAPAYPSTSLANNITGVAVAAVTIDVNGTVRDVTIVDSPDDATGTAVRNAVLRWTFRPLGVSSPADLINGKLIFYFHLQNGRGVVSSPAELQAIRGIEPTVRGKGEAPVVSVINETEFRRVQSSLGPLVLDTRSHAAYLNGHRDGAINMPFSDLSTRAGAELPRFRTIVIDCFAEQQYSGACEVAAHILTSRGMSSVIMLSRGRE